ncbi:Transmembrane 9 super member 4 [Apophysomyces sp. BC1021]|nr:Transmembrane 9 super member 4 [Apophysomyces sp. BC1021]
MSLRKSCLALAWLLLLCSLLSFCTAFNLPGTGPRAFELNEEVPLLVNKVSSLRTHLPYAYGDLPFVCKPKAIKWEGLNLGEVLQGDRVMKSNYEIRMGQNTSCLTLCDVSLSEQVSDEAAELIRKYYRVEWSVDNLPGFAFVWNNESQNSQRYYEPYPMPYFLLGQFGYRDGFIHQFGNEDAYINNHMNLEFLYEASKEDPKKKYIVEFRVSLKSYENSDSCDSHNQTTEITWADRWNRYQEYNYRVNTILIRTLKRDITNYNTDEQDVEAVSEYSTGWKLIHGDVFRPPPWSSVLPPLLGSGVQFMSMMCGTIVFVLTGLLHPSYRGGIISYALFIFVFSGSFAGYYSAKVYKALDGKSPLKNAFATATLIPGVLFVILLILDLLVWSQRSSMAIPFSTFIALLRYRKPTIEYPVRTNQIPRQIPEQAWYLRFPISMMIAGFLPFAVVIEEVGPVYRAIWSDNFYYTSGRLAFAILLVIIATVEISIVMTYFTLCLEDYRWWWKSFALSSASSFYVFMYAIAS